MGVSDIYEYMNDVKPCSVRRLAFGRPNHSITISLNMTYKKVVDPISTKNLFSLPKTDIKKNM
jgi:hypothetical protein